MNFFYSETDLRVIFTLTVTCRMLCHKCLSFSFYNLLSREIKEQNPDPFQNDSDLSQNDPVSQYYVSNFPIPVTCIFSTSYAAMNISDPDPY